MREVVTVQVGTYANFVGAHFWNFQDELLGLDPASPEGAHAADVDADVLHRVGETRQGVATYTPRLLVFDIKGSLGAVRAAGSLYEPAPTADLSTVATWGGGKAIYRSQPVPKNEFLRSLEEEEVRGQGQSTAPGRGDAAQAASTSGRTLEASYARDGQAGGQGAAAQAGLLGGTGDRWQPEMGSERQRVEALEAGVEYWTDFLKAHLHPSSVVELRAEWGERDGGGGFRAYGEGRALLGEGAAGREEAGERLRFFAEESDHLQGFQCLVDDAGGFSALGSEVLSEMADEYPRVPRIVTAVQPPTAHLGSAQRLPSLVQELTSSTSFATLSSLADLFVPLGRSSLGGGLFPHLVVDDRKQYHTSAVYAMALDSMTLPYRFASGGAMAASDAPMGGCDVASFVRLLARSPSLRVSSCALGVPVPRLFGRQSGAAATLTAGVASLTPLVETGRGRAAPSAEAAVLRGALGEGSDTPAPLPTALEALQASLLREGGGRSVRHLALSRQPLAVPLPFPFIFAPEVGRFGQVSASYSSSGWPGRPRTRPGKGGVDVVAAPILTRQSSGPPVLPLVAHRLEALQRLGLRRGSAGGALLVDWGFQREDQEELAEHLQSLVAGSGGGDHGDLDEWEE